MEQILQQEINGAPERLEKSVVLEALREKGFDDPKTEALVIQWTDEREKQVGNSVIEQLLFECERSDLYLAMGDMEGAIGLLESLLDQLQQTNQNPEQEKELFRQIDLRIEHIKTKKSS